MTFVVVCVLPHLNLTWTQSVFNRCQRADKFASEFDFFPKMLANLTLARRCQQIRDLKKIIAKMTMSWIRYDTCQSFWRFETTALVCDVVSASVLTAPVCSACMCVDPETWQGKRVYKVSLFCGVLRNFDKISLFSTISMNILTISVIGL